MDRPTPLIVITGPTCSGKTGLAFRLSRTHAMEVISADSMQVYRHMDIATAKPSREEQLLLPHHLVDVADPDQQFQAGMFAAMATEIIHEVGSRGKTPVVVGGTGLYIKALLYGLAPAPGRSETIRSALKKIMGTKGIAFLEKMLAVLDPDIASRIEKNDATRVIRSLEIVFLTGRRPSSIYDLHGFRQPLVPAKIACIMPERKILYERIDARVLNMVECGLLDETRSLLNLGYGAGLNSMQTLAYKHIISHLEGSMGLDEAIRLIQRDTRRFAKRQITWMKTGPGHEIFDSAEDAYDTVSVWLDNN